MTAAPTTALPDTVMHADHRVIQIITCRQEAAGAHWVLY